MRTIFMFYSLNWLLPVAASLCKPAFLSDCRLSTRQPSATVTEHDWRVSLTHTNYGIIAAEMKRWRDATSSHGWTDIATEARGRQPACRKTERMRKKKGRGVEEGRTMTGKMRDEGNWRLDWSIQAITQFNIIQYNHSLLLNWMNCVYEHLHHTCINTEMH